MKKIDHIAIAVQSIEKTKIFFSEKLKLEFLSSEVIEEQKVKTAIFKCGDVRIELLEPLDDSSTIKKFLQKNGNAIHHIAFEVENILNELNELESNGVRLIDKEPKIGAHNKKIAFLHPKSTEGILFELVE